MKKINENGIKLLEYKEELMKDYPKIVRDSLILALEQMMAENIIDLVTYQTIKNTNESKDSFISYLLTKKEFTKTYEELFEEYEVFRIELDEELKMHDLFDLLTETVVEKDSIYVIKKFTIDESFVMDYFGVDEADLIRIMKRRGFVEKFTALRLTKVLKDIINESKKEISILNIDNSLAYFNEDNNGYNIDLIMGIQIDDLLKLDSKTVILGEIKEITVLADKIYKSKMIC